MSEQEVLALLAEGASNKLIARRPGISVYPAKFHFGSLLTKFEQSALSVATPSGWV